MNFSKRKKSGLKQFFIGFIAFVLSVTFIMVPINTQADEGLNTRSLAMLNKPAVILIETRWTADVQIDKISVDDGIYDMIAWELQQMQYSGQLSGDVNDFISTYIDIFNYYLPDYIYTTGDVIQEQVTTSSIGTGFIITQDGYILTNAHVVQEDEEMLELQFAYDVASNYVAEIVNAFNETVSTSLGVSPSEEDLDNLTYAFLYTVAGYMRVNNLNSEVLCYLGNISSGNEASTKTITADVRKVGEAIPGKDVAILKIDKTNLPTVVLGDDTLMKTGDTVYAMGYPGVATINGVFDIDKAIQEPTLTTGIVSAKKQMNDGWEVFQTNADIHGGNSGGPLFNEKGEVIGINTFSTVDENGEEASGMNFAIPISVANQFLNELNIIPGESNFTADYKEAIKLYNEGKYRKALKILRKTNEVNPGYPVIVELLSECSLKADEEVNYQWIIWPSIIVLILVVGGGSFMVIRKKKHKDNTTENKETTKNLSTLKDLKDNMEEVENQKLCIRCGNKLDNNQKFCSQCGYVITLSCKKCGAPLEIGDKFCKNCGEKSDI